MKAPSRETGTHSLPFSLTPALAQEIAGDTSAIIGLNVIITDSHGIVLGSGDLSRVGTLHEASCSVVTNQRVEFHDAEQAARLKGTRPGMTLPILSQNTVVGTVGITGTPDQVARFGQVVKRQTEILLGESALVWARLTRERVLEALLRDLLNYDPNDPADVTARARDFGFDLGLTRRALVFEVQAGTRALATSAQAMRLIRERFSDPQDIACSVSPMRHVVLQRQLRSSSAIAASELLDLSSQIERVQGGPCAVGIGGTAADETEISHSYSEALTALRLGPTVGSETPFNIDDMRAHELLASAPIRTRQRMLGSVLTDLRDAPNWNVVCQTITAWAENGFVLVRTAEALGVHRNTLVYRLEKIAAQTGLTLNDHRRWLTLYIACITDQLHSGTAE